MLELQREGNDLILRGDGYDLVVPQSQPSSATLRVKGTRAAALFVPSTCDADGLADEMVRIGGVRTQGSAENRSIIIEAESRLWGAVEYVFRGTANSLEHFVRRRGKRQLDLLRFFAGQSTSGGARLSQPHWGRVFDPEPNARRKHYFAPNEYATIGVTSDRSYYNGNWLFTPGPFCYAFELTRGEWLATGIAARQGEHNFDHFEYRGATEGFGLMLSYGGHVTSEREWESPHVLLLPAEDEFAALAHYGRWLRERGLAPLVCREEPAWWRAPIFCGWGEQVALEGRTSIETLPAVRAADHCTQSNYERFLSILTQQGLDVGTIVLDDKWQDQYGTNVPDKAKWPDMAGFIAAQHAAGRRVLLWLRAWHPEGLPAIECLVDSSGHRLAVDPSSSQYKAHLQVQVSHMLGDLDADGFKIDFTHCLPTENGVHSAGGVWGVELLKLLIATIHDAAKGVKPDAMIMAHTANPYFADVVDVLRLNDIANVVGEPSYTAAMEQRAKVASLVSDWVIDTDNWPSPNREAWLDYCRRQGALGVPSLYYVTRVYHLGEDGMVVDEAIRPDDFAEVRRLWRAYRGGGGP